METTNSSTSQTIQTVLDQFSKEIDDCFDMLYEAYESNKELYYNQDYKQEINILKNKKELTLEDCLWLEYNYLKKEGIVVIRSKRNIEVKNFLDGTSIALFEFSSEEESDNSYIKVIKLCLDFLCHQD